MAKFIPITILAKTSDPTNRKVIHVRTDTVVKFAEAELREDDVHLVGISKVTQGTVVWFEGGGYQLVRELPEHFLEVLDTTKEEQLLVEKYGMGSGL